METLSQDFKQKNDSTRHPYVPRDHLPKSVRDIDCLRRDAERDQRQSMYAHIRAVNEKLVREMIKQRKKVNNMQRKKGNGKTLTPADIGVLGCMLRLNLNAANRKETTYNPGRKKIAKELGVIDGTVSRAIAKLKDAGLIAVYRYAKGGRNMKSGSGLATEFSTGYLYDLDTALAVLGYRLSPPLVRDLMDLANWADERVQARPGPMLTVANHTEAKCYTTVSVKSNKAHAKYHEPKAINMARGGDDVPSPAVQRQPLASKSPSQEMDQTTTETLISHSLDGASASVAAHDPAMAMRTGNDRARLLLEKAADLAVVADVMLVTADGLALAADELVKVKHPVGTLAERAWARMLAADAPNDPKAWA